MLTVKSKEQRKDNSIYCCELYFYCTLLSYGLPIVYYDTEACRIHILTNRESVVWNVEIYRLNFTKCFKMRQKSVQGTFLL